MTEQDSILQQYHKDQRSLYILATVVLTIFSVFVFYMQDSWASPIMFSVTVSFLWFFYWNTGRRVRSGMFAARRSIWSQIERADLARWLERRGATKIPDAHLPG